MTRCPWTGEDKLMIQYHDTEWGVPVHNDTRHFEFLILEGAQAGLSWNTILQRREGYREAFANFDPKAVASYDEGKIEELKENPGIIRNRLKIRSAVSNAKSFLRVQEKYGSFDAYIWAFVDKKPIKNAFKALTELPAQTELSQDISKSLKKLGFSFVGPTIIYAYMQAVGLVNDHLISCFRYKEV
ncbi:MAG: DNA-3-methyladenine glycosylase I [Candidatus Hodarchaeota archaeon]